MSGPPPEGGSGARDRRRSPALLSSAGAAGRPARRLPVRRGVGRGAAGPGDGPLPGVLVPGRGIGALHAAQCIGSTLYPALTPKVSTLVVKGCEKVGHPRSGTLTYYGHAMYTIPWHTSVCQSNQCVCLSYLSWNCFEWHQRE